MTTPKLRGKLYSSGKKIFLSDILPKKREVLMKLAIYKSNVDLSKYNGKLYADPFYSEELPTALSTYCILYGDWSVSEESDDYNLPMLKLTNIGTGQYIKICFINQANKLKFASEMYTYSEIEQESPGMNIQQIVNDNILPRKPDIDIKKAIIKYGTFTAILFTSILPFIKNIKNKKGKKNAKSHTE